MPINIRIIPPVICAADLYLPPKALPILTVTADNTKVTMPIMLTAGTISTLRKASEMPTASASMLVATASGSMVFAENEVSALQEQAGDVIAPIEDAAGPLLP